MKAIAITIIIIIKHGVGSNGGRFCRGKNSSYLLICISKYPPEGGGFVISDLVE